MPAPQITYPVKNTGDQFLASEATEIRTVVNQLAVLIDLLTADQHTHSNKAILDLVQEAFTTALKNKLDGIEANAKDDQNAAEVATLNQNGIGASNVQAELERLQGFVTATGIRHDVADITERDGKPAGTYAVDDRVFVSDDGDGKWATYMVLDITDGSGATATFRKLTDQDSLENALSAAAIRAAYLSNAGTEEFTTALLSKLNGVEANATADMTGAEIKVAYEAEADTNAFTDAEKSKLAGVEANATADMTGAEIKVAYEGEADTNAFTDAEKAKLSTVENRSNHTGSQLAATISDFDSATQNVIDNDKTEIYPGTTATLTELQGATWDSGANTATLVTETEEIGVKFYDSDWDYEKLNLAKLWKRSYRKQAIGGGSTHPFDGAVVQALTASTAVPVATKSIGDGLEIYVTGEKIRNNSAPYADDLTFIGKSHSGDFDVEMTISGAYAQANSRVGLMFRAGTDPAGSNLADFFAVTWQNQTAVSSGKDVTTFVRVQVYNRRPSNDYPEEYTGPNTLVLPLRIRMTRTGDVFRGYYHDGSVWVLLIEKLTEMSGTNTQGFIGVCGLSNDLVNQSRYILSNFVGL